MLIHRVLTTIGLSLDCVGAILLGVEAVKLENVRRFREWLDVRGHQAFRLINPEITFVDTPTPRQRRPIGELVTGAGLLVLALGVVCAVVGAIAFVLYALLHHGGGSSPASIPWWLMVLLAIGGSAVALMLLFAVIMGAEALFDLALDGIEQLDKHTPTGGVGLTGVALLVVGFIVQVVATWTS